MKKGMMSFALVLLAGSVSMASSSKVCFGSTKDDETKGVVLKIEVSQKAISITTLKNDAAGDDDQFVGGPFKTYDSVVHGRDGKTYLTYRGYASDYQEVIMVDEELLKEGTTGLLQIRARGEGFFNSVFVCKDAR